MKIFHNLIPQFLPAKGKAYTQNISSQQLFSTVVAQYPSEGMASVYRRRLERDMASMVKKTVRLESTLVVVFTLMVNVM